MRPTTATASLATLLTLGACAQGIGGTAGPPTAPGVVAVPGNGRALPAFQQDDAACRAYAAEQVAGPPLVNNGFTPGTTLQQRYDITYTQCMYSKGDTVLSSANLTGGVQVANLDYGYDYYPYYGSLLGPTVFVGGGYGYGGGYHRGWGGPHHGWAGGHGWGGHGWAGGHGRGGHGWAGGRGWAGGHGAGGGRGGGGHGGASASGGGAHGGGRG